MARLKSDYDENYVCEENLSEKYDVTFDEGREAPIGEVKVLSIALVSFLLYIRYDDHTIIP